MNQAYVYKWTHVPSLRWYVGSRTAKNSHLEDGYLCSSKIVKPLIEKAPNDWIRQIIFVGNVGDVRAFETEILVMFDAKNDKRSFNKHNQDMKFVCLYHSDETKQKIKDNHPWAGKKRPQHAEMLAGRKRKPEHIKKWAYAMRGVPKTSQHIASLKKAKSKGLYITPKGVFLSSRDAALANNCVKTNVLNKCFGYKARGKWYPPAEGWSFNPKEIA